MKQDTKDSYMKSILGEAEYEANLEDWKEEGLAEGLAPELISSCTGLTVDEIEVL